MQKNLEFWMPAIFCGFISLIAVPGHVILTFKTGASHEGFGLVFYCFLPVCFYRVGMSLSKLHQDNAHLCQRIDRLEENVNGERA